MVRWYTYGQLLGTAMIILFSLMLLSKRFNGHATSLLIVGGFTWAVFTFIEYIYMVTGNGQVQD